jgi:lysozyme
MATFNQAGFDLLKKWEGCNLQAYDDANGQAVKPGQHVYGTLTIGYGHTGPDVVPGLAWTQAQADQALQNDVAAIAEQISPLIHVPLADNQFSALLSLAFNIGVHAFTESSALSAINHGDLSGVPALIKEWNKTAAKGRHVMSRGLENRREAEAALWSTPEETA